MLNKAQLVELLFFASMGAMVTSCTSVEQYIEKGQLISAEKYCSEKQGPEQGICLEKLAGAIYAKRGYDSIVWFDSLFYKRHIHELWTKALGHYVHALKIFKKASAKKDISRVHEKIGDLYKDRVDRCTDHTAKTKIEYRCIEDRKTSLDTAAHFYLKSGQKKKTKEMADIMYNAKNYKAAGQWYGVLGEMGSLRKIGEDLFKEEKYREAGEFFEKAGYKDGYAKVASALLKSGNYYGAALYYEKANMAKEKYYEIGMLSLRGANRKAALGYFNKSDDKKAKLEAAKIYLDQGELEQAADSYRKAGAPPDKYLLIAEKYLKLNDPLNAQKYFVEGKLDLIKTCRKVSKYYLKENKSKNALHCFKQTSLPQKDIYTELANNALEIGNLFGAAEYYKQAGDVSRYEQYVLKGAAQEMVSHLYTLLEKTEGLPKHTDATLRIKLKSIGNKIDQTSIAKQAGGLVYLAVAKHAAELAQKKSLSLLNNLVEHGRDKDAYERKRVMRYSVISKFLKRIVRLRLK